MIHIDNLVFGEKDAVADATIEELHYDYITIRFFLYLKNIDLNALEVLKKLKDANSICIDKLRGASNQSLTTKNFDVEEARLWPWSGTFKEKDTQIDYMNVVLRIYDF